MTMRLAFWFNSTARPQIQPGLLDFAGTRTGGADSARDLFGKLGRFPDVRAGLRYRKAEREFIEAQRVLPVPVRDLDLN